MGVGLKHVDNQWYDNMLIYVIACVISELHVDHIDLMIFCYHECYAEIVLACFILITSGLLLCIAYESKWAQAVEHFKQTCNNNIFNFRAVKEQFSRRVINLHGENIKGLHKYCEFYKERSIQAPISKSLKGIDNTTASC